MEVNVLANWNNKAGTYGQLQGTGTLTDNKTTIKSEKSLLLQVSLISKDSLEASFQDCDNYQLTDRFNGIYMPRLQ
ncbi:hypothetical protein CS542_00970 [Pedobacter sp. IW39]|nr:hypothetical protein CS542_00970 [Pedobacter sp. IW39]